jgi:hypothetical protein
MAQSSIHIEEGKSEYLAHNDRSQRTENSIFTQENNEVSNSHRESIKIYIDELAKRSEAYKKRTGQKLQKKAITHLSAIVNLNLNHTMQDMQKVADYLEEKLDTKVFQIAVHKDEGHVNQNGLDVINGHAHVEMLGLDSLGQSVRRKLTKRFLSKMQTDIAKILGMGRGINYAKTKTKSPPRKPTYEYKRYAEEKASHLKELQELQAEHTREKALEKKKQIADFNSLYAQEKKKLVQSQELTTKELKAIISELRKELQTQSAERSAYAELEQINKELKIIMKIREFDEDDFIERIRPDDCIYAKYDNKEGKSIYIAAYNQDTKELLYIKDSYKQITTLNDNLSSVLGTYTLDTTFTKTLTRDEFYDFERELMINRRAVTNSVSVEEKANGTHTHRLKLRKIEALRCKYHFIK